MFSPYSLCLLQVLVFPLVALQGRACLLPWGGSVSSELPFQWQSYSDLLALLYLNNKPYILKQFRIIEPGRKLRLEK